MKDKDLSQSNETDSQLTEKPVSSQQVFDGKLLQVYLDEVKLPDGSRSTRDWIKHPGACAVVPVFEDGSVMLLKQFRYPPRQTFIEVPAGKIDPGEDPDLTARRELEEETGLTAENLYHAGSFYPAIGYADEIIHIYTAWGLSEKTKHVDDDEFILNYRVPFSKVMSMIDTGQISDGKTICSLTKAWLWWKKHEPFKVDLDF